MSPTTLAAGATCAMTVTFTPAATGARAGTLSITDNAAESPHTVSLMGTGISAVSLSTSSLTFAAQTVGTTSKSKKVTLKNLGGVPLAIDSITIGGGQQRRLCADQRLRDKCRAQGQLYGQRDIQTGGARVSNCNSDVQRCRSDESTDRDALRDRPVAQ
jgi:hypothetical protein